MKDKMIQITMSVSNDCYIAMEFLRKKKISPLKYLREGGEQLVIEIAQKNRLTLKKNKPPF